MFIVFEGCDKSGKTTQAKELVKTLEEQGISAKYTTPFSGGYVGERVKRIFRGEVPETKLCSMQELLVSMASILECYREVIEPCLLERKVIVCDRWTLSSFMYQSYCGNIGNDHYEPIVSNALYGRMPLGSWPHLTVIMDTKFDIVKSRLPKDNKDIFEKRGDDFIKKIIGGYQAVMANRQGFNIDEAKTRIGECVNLDIRVPFGRAVEDINKDLYKIVTGVMQSENLL